MTRSETRREEPHFKDFMSLLNNTSIPHYPPCTSSQTQQTKKHSNSILGRLQNNFVRVSDQQNSNNLNKLFPYLAIQHTKGAYWKSLDRTTVIAEIFVREKISYSGVCRLSYAGNFRTATVVSDTLVYVYGFRMLLNFVLSAKSTKYTKLNRVRKFVQLQYPNTSECPPPQKKKRAK